MKGLSYEMTKWAIEEGVYQRHSGSITHTGEKGRLQKGGLKEDMAGGRRSNRVIKCRHLGRPEL